jgi:hypothetical protein
MAAKAKAPATIAAMGLFDPAAPVNGGGAEVLGLDGGGEIVGVYDGTTGTGVEGTTGGGTGV